MSIPKYFGVHEHPIFNWLLFYILFFETDMRAAYCINKKGNLKEGQSYKRFTNVHKKNSKTTQAWTLFNRARSLALLLL